MSTSKRPRGRPRGSGKNDWPWLEQVADLMVQDPSLRATPAIKRVLRSRADWGATDATLIRRWQRKFQMQRDALLMAARDRARPQAVATFQDHPCSTIGPGAIPSFFKQVEALRNSPFMKQMEAIHNSPLTKQIEAMRNSPLAKQIEAMRNSPWAKQIEAMRDSPWAKQIEAMRNSPLAKQIEAIHNSPFMKHMQATHGSPLMKEAIRNWAKLGQVGTQLALGQRNG